MERVLYLQHPQLQLDLIHQMSLRMPQLQLYLLHQLSLRMPQLQLDLQILQIYFVSCFKMEHALNALIELFSKMEPAKKLAYNVVNGIQQMGYAQLVMKVIY